MIHSAFQSSRLRLAASLPLALAAVCMQAATFTWDGNGGTGSTNWSTANNWNPNTAPTRTSGHDLIFATGNKLTNNANGGDWTISSLTFSNTAGAFTLGGNDLYLGSGGITNNSTSTQTIDNQLNLSANQS